MGTPLIFQVFDNVTEFLAKEVRTAVANRAPLTPSRCMIPR